MTMIRFSRCVSGAGVAGNGTGADAASPYPPTLASMDVQYAALNGAPADRLPSIKAIAAGVSCGAGRSRPGWRMAVSRAGDAKAAWGQHAVSAPQFIHRHICGMANQMKTTFNIDDTVMAELRQEAARQGRTMSELVET